MFIFVTVIDEVGIMFLYEGDWVQNGNMYYFEGYQGNGIKLKKTTTYEELLKIVLSHFESRSNRAQSFDEVCIQWQYTNHSYTTKR